MNSFPKCTIPELIRSAVEKAMAFYPLLHDSAIHFKFSDKVRKSFMQAQPRWQSLFSSKKNRSYKILISKKFKVEDMVFSIKDIPEDVLVGWIGHELGHVMDYRDRSVVGMIMLGVKYLYSDLHIQEVERAADNYAVRQGMGEYILKTKNFILNHSSLSEGYKERIKKYYLSPEEIMQLVDEYNATGNEPKLQ